jgi:membrane protein implicated in regulation of membrane protease activity
LGGINKKKFMKARLYAMGKFKEKIMQFMKGRYGTDELSLFFMGVIAISLIVGATTKYTVFFAIAFVVLIFSYVRMLSKNYSKRHHENQVYLQGLRRITNPFKQKLSRMRQSKDYRFFKCPGCKTRVRIPRRKGKVQITCPKCQNKFLRKS